MCAKTTTKKTTTKNINDNNTMLCSVYYTSKEPHIGKFIILDYENILRLPRLCE